MLFFNNILRRGQDERTRELQKLRRQDLLELLLDQMREGEALQTALADRERKIEQLTDLSERLKAKLDLKDEQIERLKGRLDLKDSMIAQMIVGGRKAPVDLARMEELLIAEEHALEAMLLRQAEEEAATEDEAETGDFGVMADAAEPEAPAVAADEGAPVVEASEAAGASESDSPEEALAKTGDAPEGSEESESADVGDEVTITEADDGSTSDSKIDAVEEELLVAAASEATEPLAVEQPSAVDGPEAISTSLEEVDHG